MKAVLCRVVMVGALLLGAGAQAQQGDDDTARARTHFEAGRALYALGYYADALREFVAGYQLVPKPRFVLNIGHSHRKLGQHDKARDAYRKFLAEVTPDDPDRAEAQKYLSETERALARAPDPTPGPTATPPPDPRAEPAITQTAPPPDRKRSPLLHLAWAVPVGAVVIVGVALGIYFGTRSSECVPGSGVLACIDARPQ